MSESNNDNKSLGRELISHLITGILFSALTVWIILHFDSTHANELKNKNAELKASNELLKQQVTEARDSIKKLDKPDSTLTQQIVSAKQNLQLIKNKYDQERTRIMALPADSSISLSARFLAREDSLQR